MKLELKKMDFSNLKFKEDNELKQIEPDILSNILNKYYYGDENLTKILKEFNIKIVPRNFSKCLPLINTKIQCPYDGTNMYSKLPSKSGMNSWNNDVICLKCGHTIFQDSFYSERKICQCSGCINEMENRKKSLSKVISNAFSNIEQINYESLSLEDILNLSMILQQFHSEGMKDIGIFAEHRNLDFKTGVLKKLTDKKILIVSSNSNIESFLQYDKDEIKYYLDKVNWNINVCMDGITEETLFNILKFPNIGLQLDFTENEVSTVYRKVVKKEMSKIVNYEFDELSLDISKKSDKEKMSDAIDRWLLNYSPAEVYGFIWQGVRNANTARTRNVWGNYVYHQTDFVIKLIDEIILNKVKNNKIKPFNYPSALTESLVTKILFTQIMSLPDWFSKMVPYEDDERLDYSSVKSLKNISKQIFTDNEAIKTIIENAVSFSIEDYGIVVFDGSVDWLFSDQVTIFNYFKNDDNDSEWLNTAMNNFYIDNFYSFSFLSNLQKALKDAKDKGNI